MILHLVFNKEKKNKGMQYRYERAAVEYLKKNDETVFNLLFLTLSTIVLKTVDENMTCRRNQELSTLTIIDDFWSGQYGYDKECLQWKSTIQTFSLLTTILSLVFLTNQAFDGIQEKKQQFYSLPIDDPKFCHFICFDELFHQILFKFFKNRGWSLVSWYAFDLFL